MAQRHAPDLRRDLVGNQRVEPALRPGSGDLVLGEGSQVDDADALAHEARFIAHVLEIVAAPEAPAIATLNSGRRKPVGALPAIPLSPHRSFGIDLVVHRAGLRRPRVGALFVRKMDSEDAAVGFLILLYDVALARVRAKTPRIHRQHVDARLALDNPFGELPAGAAGRGDAEAVSFVQPHVGQTPRRSDERTAVRGVGDRAVDDVLDAAVLERRHAALGCLHVRHEPIEIAREKVTAEPVRHPVGKARRRALLVGTQDPAQALLAQVVGLIGLAQHGELAPATVSIGLKFGGLFVDDVLVLDRNGGHIQTEESPGLARIVAGCQHQVLGGDVALAGVHPPLAGWPAFDGQRLGLLIDLSARAARALAQRHGEIGGRDVAIVGVIQRAHDGGRVGAAAEFHQRPQFLHARGTDDFEGHADGVGGAAILLVLVHALFAGGEAQIAGNVKAHVLAGLGVQALVQIDRVLVQLADGVAHVEQRQEARGVPGGARGELGALDQRDIRPALLCQVIERADADDAATDDQDPNVRLHGMTLHPGGAKNDGGLPPQSSGRSTCLRLQLRRRHASTDPERGFGEESAERKLRKSARPRSGSTCVAVRHRTTSALASMVRVHMLTGKARASRSSGQPAASSVAACGPLHAPVRSGDG